MKRLLGAGILLLAMGSLKAQSQQLSNENWQAAVNENGTLHSLLVKEGVVWDSIPMMQDTLQGVSWYYVKDKQSFPVALRQNAAFSYRGKINEVDVTLQYGLKDRCFVITATATNHGSSSFQPEKLGLHVGISNYMAGYPQWNKVYFPTMLRCEKTHFGGYLSTPANKLLLIASPDPIASWSINYNFGYGPKNAFFWGHRIYTFNLDLLNTLPLPVRHPQQQTALQPGESRTWTIRLQQTDQLEDVEKELAQLTQAPAFDIPQTTQEAQQPFSFVVHGQLQSLTVTTPTGKKQPLRIAAQNTYLPADGPGVYTLTAVNVAGKSTEAMISVRKPWSWYLQQARVGALKYTQKASWNCENWYGFYSAYLAQEYFPDQQLQQQTDDRFHKVMQLMYDKDWHPTENKHRIQNHTTTIGILVDKYKSANTIADLEAAATLADWIIEHAQSKDGAYRNGHTHYTSVIYVAKSIMELMAEEKKLLSDPVWATRYQRHYASVKRAIDQLMGGVTGLDTEGEMTLEDGMISCTALQIGAFALLQDKEADRKRYTDSMLYFLDMHNCLTQLVKPDSRQRGGTLRYWEAQYDVLLANNMFSSPHGWTAWKVYATYYAYLLTGEEKWLVQTMNALGSCVQVVDFKTGNLRWAFVGDPYVNTTQSNANFPNTSAGKYNDNQYKTEEGSYQPVIVGEQYVPMIADWFSANSSDNDVHEIFKCMEEVALTNAFVLQRKDGSILAFNCRVQQKPGELIVTPAETWVGKVHVNLAASRRVSVKWKQGSTVARMQGRQWITRSGR